MDVFIDFMGKQAKKIKRISAGVILVILAIVAVFNSAYSVGDQECAVVLTFGEYTSTERAGLNFKIPFIQNYKIVPLVTGSFTMGWNSDNPPPDVMVMNGLSADMTVAESARPGGSTIESEALMITSDFNFVLTDLYVEWKVTDPVKYLYATGDIYPILRNVVQASTKKIVSMYSVDDALTSSKAEIQTKIYELVNDTLDSYDFGVSVVNIIVQDIEPPTYEVQFAFNDVENARQEKDTSLNEAKAYSNEKLPEARARADSIKKEAEAVKNARIEEANGQVSRFNELYTEYASNPEITRLRLYYETMESILPKAKIFVQDPNGVIKSVQLN